MSAPVIQFKRGAFANLPGLQAGEPALTTDTFELYVGIDSTTNNNKFFGSHRYWTKNTTTTGSGVNFVEGSNNGTDFVTIKAPGTLAGIVTFTLPGADGTNGQILTTNGSGTLSFSSPSSSSFTIAGGTGTDTFNTGGTLTFAGTANEIETVVTNDQVQIGLPDNVIVGGALTVTGNTTLGDAGGDLITVVGVTTFTTSNVFIDNQLFVGGLQVSGGAVIGQDIETRHFAATGVSTVTSLFATNISASGIITATSGFVGNVTGTASSTTNIPNLTGAITSVNTTTSLGSFSSADLSAALTDETGSGAAVFATSPTLVTPVLGAATATSINVSGITTTGTLTLSGTPGIGITGISSSTSLTENSHTFLPTQAAVKAYVDAVDVTLGINADTGGASTVATSQTLTISGTANEVNTSVSGQTITVGLPDSVTVTTALTTPTVNATNLKANDGTTAITITNSTGAVATNSDLTVGGNLYVNGSTTQVNSTALTVEDRTIDLGIVNGAAPAGTTTWDLGVLFNYNSSGAKKSAVIWEHGDARFKFASVLSSDTNGTDVDTPQLTVTTFAPVEIGQLWVTDCAGTSQVISCTGSTRNLENITIDAGTF
jgi:hypothetical protein